MRSAFRTILLAAALVAQPVVASAADWEFKPFLGVTFGGDTTFVDLDQQAGHAKLVVGGSATLIGEVLGIEGDFGHTPAFFTGGRTVLQSSVTTLTGNVVVAMPRHLTQYSLRPYVVGGFGLMAVRKQDAVDVFSVSRNMAAIDVGGGATGFLTGRIGLSWDVRYFRNVGGTQVSGNSFGEEQLSFWRATMAVAIRY